MQRYLTVHGHFYQPPREDPANGRIPREPGAAPFHDYNEKILAECYRPNAKQGSFASMSFDIGPTLGLWMRRRHPLVLDEIVASDRDSVMRAGYGNALMQSFHHTILPLASQRDRLTELRWGRRWFEHTFGRTPAGIWLPETAVDLATLEACAAEGLWFTILSPEQAEQAAGPIEPG
ncbi:MAG TPA: glycoside hydrolase, partial [Thermomicrobiaceae bacterium]|nr:glycoside hydrolase [Thermomicrobiaceae bacterium]